MLLFSLKKTFMWRLFPFTSKTEFCATVSEHISADKKFEFHCYFHAVFLSNCVLLSVYLSLYYVKIRLLKFAGTGALKCAHRPIMKAHSKNGTFSSKPHIKYINTN